MKSPGRIKADEYKDVKWKTLPVMALFIYLDHAKQEGSIGIKTGDNSALAGFSAEDVRGTLVDCYAAVVRESKKKESRYRVVDMTSVVTVQSLVV